MLLMGTSDIFLVFPVIARVVSFRNATGSCWQTWFRRRNLQIFSPKGIIDYWWVFLPVTVALILFGIGWNLLGDGLIEAMNPRSVQN